MQNLAAMTGVHQPDPIFKNNQMMAGGNPNFANNLLMPPGLPNLDKSSSSYTYSTKKARKQHWLSHFKQNKKLQTEMLLKGYDLRKEPRSFLLTIKGISGVPLREVVNASDNNVQGSKFSLEYYVTLFNRNIGTHGSFYGRTYRSQPLPLRESGGSWDSQQEEFIFFHTSYTEKTSFAVIECVIVKDFAGQKTYLSAGYALCSIFDFGGATTVELIKGSPRSIGQVGLDATTKSVKSQGKLMFEMRDFPAFDQLKVLVPQNSFCGAQDVIPGLVSDKFPNPRGQGGNLGQVKIELMPKTTVYIHNIQMMTQIAFESRFENFLRKMKQEKLRTARGHYNTTTTDNVYIAERRMIVCANNTWKNVCEDTYVSMSPPNEQGVSQSGGSLTLKNFICHPLVSIVFRIEYKAVLPTDQANESAFFTLGWTFHVPTYNAAGQLTDENFETEVDLGPGSVPTGELLWDPNADDINHYQVRLKAFVSTSPQAPAGSYDPALRQNKVVVNQQLQMGSKTGAVNQGLSPQEMQMIQEKERQINELKAKLELQQRNEQDITKQIEMAEMARLRNQNSGTATGNDQRYQEEIRLLQLRKQQMENEMLNMRTDMKQYLESMKESIVNTRPQQYNQPGYADHFNHLQGQPLQNSTQQQIAMIGNVFYNMLNMIGESERDKRIIGLSDNLKKMVQQSKFDDLLAPKAPYVGMGQVNLLKTTDLPLTDQINFIKMGQGELLLHPSAQVTTTSIYKDRLSLDLEKADQLKASTITFKFLCYKTPFGNFDNLPKKLYFQLKFFTFPAVITDKVKIKSQNELDLVLRPGQTYYLSKEHPGVQQQLRTTMTSQMQQTKNQDTLHDPNLLQMVFEIDPSLSRIKDENVKLAQYLRERFLTVDVFDGDSLFLYGTCKIPLFELLRQGRSTVVRAKECEMCDPETGDFRGALQLIMSNQGRVQSVTEDELAKNSMTQKITGRQESPMKSRIQPSQTEGSGKKKYKKVVKSKPMDLTKMQQTNNEANLLATHLGTSTALVNTMNEQQISHVSMNNADLRKKLRVDRVRKMTMGHQNPYSATNLSIEDPTQPDWAKYKSLREIEMIRETKKDQIISRVMDDYYTGSDQLSVIPGQLEFFTATIHNPFNQNEVFTVHINDPDDQFLKERELQLVTDQVEWRHWVGAGKCQRPFAYDIITPNGDIILKPNDQVEVLFKFMTMREVSSNSHIHASVDFIKPRKIQVIILQSNKQPFTTIELQVVPSSAPVDHTFRFYEPQNSHVTLSIPPFIQLNHPGLCAFVSKPNATVEFNPQQPNSFKIETKTEDAPNITEMTMFVYGDQFRENLLATCQIEVYSLVTIYTKIKAGVQTTQSLQLPAENARQVQVFSNNHRLVYLPQRAINSTFKIIPQTVNHLQVCVKTFLPYQQKVRIHCTDVNTGELVYQWLMIIDADAPNVTKKLEVVCKVNHSSVQSLEFINKLSQKTVYEFASSRPDFVVPKLEAVTFESREAKLIDLCFTPQPKYGTADVCIYANDLEYNVVECYQLKVTYMP